MNHSRTPGAEVQGLDGALASRVLGSLHGVGPGTNQDMAGHVVPAFRMGCLVM